MKYLYSKVLFAPALMLIMVFCKGSKHQKNSLLIGQWKCVSHLRVNDQEQVDLDKPLPCVYDLYITQNGLTLLDGRGDNGAWPYIIKDNTIFIGLDFGEAFRIKKLMADSLVIVRTPELSGYKKPLTQMTFIR